MSDNLSYRSIWFQSGLWRIVLATSVIVSEITPHRLGHGAPPKVRRRATRTSPSKMVRLSQLVSQEEEQRL